MSKPSPPPPRRHRPLLGHDVDTTASEIREIRVKSVEWQPPPTRGKKRKAPDDGGDVDNGWYKVFYTVFIQKYDKKTERINVSSIKDMGGDPSSVMMERTRDAIHKRQDELNINYQLGSGPMYMDKDDFWKYLWVYAENEINNNKVAKEARSAAKRKAHQTRADAIKQKEWEKGEEFKDAPQKHRAKASIMSAIEQATNKETKKAEAVLSSVINDLTKEGLNEERVLTDHTFQLLATAADMLGSVKALIKQMSKNMTLKSARLLTGLVAMMVPQLGRVSIRDYSRLIGVNRDAKYFCDALDNRDAYEKYLELDGPIQVGEKVICRGGEGVLVKMDGDSPTIELHPFNTQKKYNTITAAQMRRLPPQLDGYNRDERCDKTPEYVIEIIDTFFRRHVAMSPNKNDAVKRRHKKHRTQVEVKQAMLRYESMDELWATFKIEHPEVAAQLQNNNMPHKCPMLLRLHAPWEMIKAKDVSCLCINCEGMNALLRGVCAATDAINRIVDRVGPNTNTHVERQIGRLLTIKELINLPSKYEMCVRCLSPCLKTGKLEDAEQKCLDGTCTTCGFERLWGRKVRPNLFRIDVEQLGQQPATLNVDSPLVGDGDEWSAATIDWRRYAYEVVPTPASTIPMRTPRAADSALLQLVEHWLTSWIQCN
jgi:hypothetical protein